MTVERATISQHASRKSQPPFSGYLLIILGATFFSLKPILVKLAYAEGIDSVVLMTLRMGFSLPIYLVIAWLALRNRAANPQLSSTLLMRVFLIGILGYYGASYLDLLGLTYITAQFERLILYSYPTMTAVLGWLFFAQKLTGRMLIALLCTYIGIALVFGHDFSNFGEEVLLGASLVFASALCFTLYLLFSKREISLIGSKLFTCFSMSAASLIILLHFSLTHALDDLWVSQTLLLLSLAIAIFCTVIPSFLVAEAINRIGPAQASIVGGAGPVITTVFAVYLLGEQFTVYHLAALVLVIAGVLMLSLKRPDK